MNIRPLRDRIVVKPLEGEEKTAGGIYLPDTAKEKPQQGEVIAVGPGRFVEEKGDRARGNVRVQTRRSDASIDVIIADDGRPVPAEVASKIFDPFFTTKAPGKGTGLGLSVVMGTIKRNGGTVNLRTDGDFKEFVVSLPLEKAANG